MEIICATSGIIGIVRPGQGIIDTLAAGFENILLDLTQFCPEGELENTGKRQEKTDQNNRSFITRTPSKMYETVEPVLSQYKKFGLCTPIAYAPHLPRDTKRGDLTPLLYRLTQESLRTCGQAGCSAIIVRPLFSGIDQADSWQANREYYLGMLPLARENNVQILLENQCQDINGHLVRGICSDSREAALWVDWLNAEAGEQRFGFCVDVGTCNICGQNMHEFVRCLGERVKAVILRDNDGQKETSLLPFTCTAGGGQPRTDWMGLIRGLREIHFDGQLILNFSDTAASFSPILRPSLMGLAKAAAEYFKWQIGIENTLRKYSSIVLFGAGNMCRNYMKCYGEKYPPLFTCDNDSRIWGTNFCGLEVKSPDSLKTLPGDCAIFICNIYYREIERQLKDMGIKNNIEFFNDEYMPSFYFDRLERR